MRPKHRDLSAPIFVILLSLFTTSAVMAQDAGFETKSARSATWSTHAHDAQHTGLSSVAAQTYAKIHWKTRVDFHPDLSSGEILIHYGSPLVTSTNTIVVPVKIGSNSFEVQARNATRGALLWTLRTHYRAPSAGFLPSFGPALSKTSLLIPDEGGTLLVRENPDQTTGTTASLVFYGVDNFTQHRKLYSQNVMINTPITVDAQGNIFFGFLTTGPTPIGLQSGLARIDKNGTGSWISATAASGDSGITKVAMNCAPALSKDGKTLYVAMGSVDFGFGYLMALDSKTLQPRHQARLIDPASGLDANITDESSSTPTIGPDGDVYYGVLENPFPSHNDRGWLLHFSSDLSQVKIPGSFGWDDTASIVPASMVKSYEGSSKYLVATKYNNYAGINTGDGINKIAVLDPNAGMPDLVIPGATVMSDVLTIQGVTPDPRFPTFPGAVKEWCINTEAVDPVSKSIIANDEDGVLYRWDLTTNTLSEKIVLTKGIAEAYTPTIIGNDGTVYAINDSILFAVGK